VRAAATFRSSRPPYYLYDSFFAARDRRGIVSVTLIRNRVLTADPAGVRLRKYFLGYHAAVGGRTDPLFGRSGLSG
jgi:hypothetical protein